MGTAINKEQDWPDADALDESASIVLDQYISNEEKIRCIMECLGLTGRNTYGR